MSHVKLILLWLAVKIYIKLADFYVIYVFKLLIKRLWKIKKIRS